MIDTSRDSQSPTTFRRHSGDFVKQLKKNKLPVVVTVKGKAVAVEHKMQESGRYGQRGRFSRTSKAESLPHE